MPNPNPSTSPQRQPPPSGIPEQVLQADTFQRSAANFATGGASNIAAAAADALFDRNAGDWLTHYKAGLQNQLSRDAYDAAHRPVAVALGDALGLYLLARTGFAAGARGSAALPIRMKGQLGEGLSAIKTVLKGDRPAGFQVRKVLNNSKATVVDHVTAKGMNVEAKFGPAAKLSTNQRYAQQQFGPLYRVDHWLPEHVGYITAPLGPAARGLLSWGMHYLNAPHEGGPSPAAPPADRTSRDEDGGSQYSGWQGTPYPAIY